MKEGSEMIGIEVTPSGRDSDKHDVHFRYNTYQETVTTLDTAELRRLGEKINMYLVRRDTEWADHPVTKVAEIPPTRKVKRHRAMEEKHYPSGDIRITVGFVEGGRYRLSVLKPERRIAREWVMTYLGENGPDHGEWSARPEAGTQNLPWAWVVHAEMVPANTPTVIDKRVSR